LQELFNSLENEQKHILFEIVKNKKNIRHSEYLFDLTEKGLIKRVGDKYSITIGFLTDYIKSIQIQNVQKSVSQSEEITARIEELVILINKSHHNKKGVYIFMPVNDDLTLFRDLKNDCLSVDQFANFSSSLYHIVFERTKKEVGGIDKTKARLPTQFKRNNQFIQIVDIMRHSLGGGHLMDTFTQRRGQMTKGQMLNILTGSKNEPSKPEDFYNLQIKVLNLFEGELKKLKTIVKNM
jgi:hypothetical protein